MKIFLSLLLVLGVFGLLWVSRDNAWTNTLPAYRRLEPGERNPELVKVQESWPLARMPQLFKTLRAFFGSETRKIKSPFVAFGWVAE